MHRQIEEISFQDHTSAFGFYPRGPLPVISVAKEDALFLRRLLAKGPVRVAFDIQNSFDMSPAKERNVIADLPGANPDAIILIGAHFGIRPRAQMMMVLAWRRYWKLPGY